MGQTPDEIRAEIERTRAELTSDVDLLAEKVSPARVVERKVEATKSSLTGIREKVMGSDDSSSGQTSGISGAASGAASGIAGRVSDVASTLTGKASGTASGVSGTLSGTASGVAGKA